MRKAKQFLSLALSFLLLFSLVACTPTDGDGSTTGGSTTTADTSSENSDTPTSGNGVVATTTTAKTDPGNSGSSNNTGGSNSKPADEWTIIPAGYGTDAWKPFGTPDFYDDQPLTSNATVFPNTDLKTVNDRTRLYVNGKETAPIMYFGAFMTSGQVSEVMSTIGHMMDTGNNNVFVDVHINIENKNVRYASIKTALEDVLLEYPEANLLVRYTPWASAEFYGGSNDENITFADGSQPGPASLASDSWINGAVQQTRELIAYLSEYPEIASHILGYIPLVYNSGEWFSYDYWEGPIDYSAANQRKFREWLRYRYDNDVAALRKAWGNSSVTFETAEIPDTIAGYKRNAGDNGELFQLDTQYRPSVDYLLYYNDLTTSRLEQFARAVKMETKDRSLFIAFYGYHTELFSSASGHYNMSQLLNNEDIDMLGGPVNYESRNEGGTGISMTFANSVNSNNKIWMDESDYRSYFTYQGLNADNIQSEDGLFQVMRRVMGRLMVEGSGTWWADIASLGWFNDREFWEEVKELSDLYVKYNQIAGKSGYDIAFILDEAGASLSGSPWAHFWNLLRTSRHNIASSGLSFSMYTMADLMNGKVDEPVLVMLNCYSLTASQQKKLEAQVHKDGRTVMWMTGFGELSSTQVKALTGMDFMQVKNFNYKAINLKSNTAANFSGSGTVIGNILKPLYKVTSSDVKVLGTFDDGTAGLVSKKVGNSTQIFCASDMLTAPLLKSVAKMSGINVYLSSDDVYYGNDSLAVIHTKTAGNKTITLPQKSDVYCYFTGKWYLGVTEVTVNMKKQATEYFFIGNQKELQAAGIG